MPPRRKTTTKTDPEPRLKYRRYGCDGHVYYLDGDKVPGVTTILGALPKQLTQWSSDCAANYAVEHWDELAEETLTKRIDKIRYAYRDARQAAAVRGKDIHKLGEQLAGGEPVDVPDELKGPVTAYARFLDRWDITPLAVETPLASTQYSYGGTADLWCNVGARSNASALVDLKTGKDVYESTVLQLAGYRYADLWQPDGPESECEKPDVDLVYVAHIVADDVRLLPVDCGPDQLRAFLYVKQTWHWLEAHGYRGEEPLIGEAERPGSRQGAA